MSERTEYLNRKRAKKMSNENLPSNAPTVYGDDVYVVSRNGNPVAVHTTEARARRHVRAGYNHATMGQDVWVWTMVGMQG